MAAGIGCVVTAPGKIERPARDRVKTDRRDAERLMRVPMIAGLVESRIRLAISLPYTSGCARIRLSGHFSPFGSRST